MAVTKTRHLVLFINEISPSASVFFKSFESMISLENVKGLLPLTGGELQRKVKGESYHKSKLLDGQRLASAALFALGD